MQISEEILRKSTITLRPASPLGYCPCRVFNSFFSSSRLYHCNGDWENRIFNQSFFRVCCGVLILVLTCVTLVLFPTQATKYSFDLPRPNTLAQMLLSYNYKEDCIANEYMLIAPDLTNCVYHIKAVDEYLDLDGQNIQFPYASDLKLGLERATVSYFSGHCSIMWSAGISVLCVNHALLYRQTIQSEDYCAYFAIFFIIFLLLPDFLLPYCFPRDDCCSHHSLSGKLERSNRYHHRHCNEHFLSYIYFICFTKL